MLVLARKLDEKIIVDSCIEITIVDIRDGVVRLGFEAPRSVDIDRVETWEAKHGTPWEAQP
jgi:carbon storage regulator